ncbi:MAG: hypothetical protein M1608_13985, partial [Candidatus Omnitrophica bacterium]|nr:hypothetical protein [Candidatus Omnitrophota bacterium]
MKTSLSTTGGLALGLGLLMAFQTAKAEIQVGDAYARGSADGQNWVIGTKSIEMTFACQGDRFRLTSYRNKLYDPPIEYVDAKAAAAPFLLESAHFGEQFKVERLWSKPFVGNAVVDPGLDHVQVTVRQGDMIGFSVGPHGAFEGDQVRWITTLDYGDGESYSSSQDPEVHQGPIWYYYVQSPGTGFLELIDSVEKASNVGENIRIPSEQSGFRAPGNTPHVGPTVMHPSNDYDALRVWKAPKAGTVTIRGRVEHVGGGDVDVAIYRITEKSREERAAGQATEPWTLQSASAREVTSGGRPAVQLDMNLTHEALRAHLSVTAFPGTAVMRQSVEFENTGESPLDLKLKEPMPAYAILGGENATDYTSYWIIGGNSQPVQGKMESAPITATYHHSLNGSATWNYVPWMALHRVDGAKDGLFIALEYLGNWRLSVDHEPDGPVAFSASAADLRTRTLKPGERFALPLATLGVFRENFDNMAEDLYNWQYEYLWDYTHDDYYTRMPFTVAWYGDSDNLQQQWAGHLADLDFHWADYFRTVGMELLWEDAGWSATQHWWDANLEGPDFGRTQRFLPKNDMKLIVWIPGHQDPGLLDNKVGAWGDFQRRTDGMGFNAQIDPIFRRNTIRFLTDHPRCSFHTCSGGSSYAHTFDVQRYADVNYDSDGPGSDFTNYYWSYLETPDKWFDNLNCWQGAKGVVYNPETGRRYLTQVPKWGLYISEPDIESMRLIADLYHYLLQEGVAGRWSYISHPVIKGDKEHYYCQRLNYDRTKSIIIFKHLAKNPLTIYRCARYLFRGGTARGRAVAGRWCRVRRGG